MKIAIDASGFSELIGAVDFLRNLILGLKLRQGHKFYLLISTKPFLINKNNISNKIGTIPFLKKFKKEVKKIEKIIDSNRCNSFEKVDLNEMNKYIENVLGDGGENIKVITYSTKREIYQRLNELKIDVIIPTINPYKNQKYISYLFDCQHKYYLHFFSKMNLFFRERYFSKICKGSKAIIVNSKNAKDDLIKFYDTEESKIFNLPFAPLLKESSLKNKTNVAKKYKLPKKYFIVSNQFWKHKSLETVFEALSILRKEGKEYFVVFTGTMEDDRFPGYVDELKKYVKKLKIENNLVFLGLIPKRDQLEILKNAVAVVQPTLFEGGPGGGSVYDAVSLGVRVIATDIPINLELPVKEGYLELFKKQNPLELSQKLVKFWGEKYVRPNNEKLTAMKKQYLKRLSDSLYDVIEKVMKEDYL